MDTPLNLTQINSSFTGGEALNITQELSQPIRLLNWICVSTSSVVLIFQSIGLMTLYKCKKMSFQLKQLSYNFILSDALFHGIGVILSLMLLHLGIPYFNLLFYSRTILLTICLPISLASIAGLTLERLMALCMTMQYTSLVNKRNLIILTSHIWLTHSIVPVVAIVVPFRASCSLDLHRLSSCDLMNSLLSLRVVILVFYLIYHTFIIAAYVRISKVVRHHASNITKHTVSVIGGNVSPNGHNGADKRNKSSATNAIKKIVLIYEIFNLPILANTLALVCFPSFGNSYFQVMFQTFTYFSNIVNTYVSLYFYVWRIRECKYIFLKAALFWNNDFKAKAEKMRISLYDIVTRSK